MSESLTANCTFVCHARPGVYLLRATVPGIELRVVPQDPALAHYVVPGIDQRQEGDFNIRFERAGGMRLPLLEVRAHVILWANHPFEAVPFTEANGQSIRKDAIPAMVIIDDPNPPVAIDRMLVDALNQIAFAMARVAVLAEPLFTKIEQWVGALNRRPTALIESTPVGATKKKGKADATDTTPPTDATPPKKG